MLHHAEHFYDPHGDVPRGVGLQGESDHISATMMTEDEEFVARLARDDAEFVVRVIASVLVAVGVGLLLWLGYESII